MSGTSRCLEEGITARLGIRPATFPPHPGCPLSGHTPVCPGPFSAESPAAPPDAFSPPQVPCYSYGQKLSKLAILRIACNYILSLARLADLDYSADHSNLSFSECVQRCTRTLQAEGRAKKRKVRSGHAGGSLQGGQGWGSGVHPGVQRDWRDQPLGGLLRFAPALGLLPSLGLCVILFLVMGLLGTGDSRPRTIPPRLPFTFAHP